MKRLAVNFPLKKQNLTAPFFLKIGIIEDQLRARKPAKTQHNVTADKQKLQHSVTADGQKLQHNVTADKQLKVTT